MFKKKLSEEEKSTNVFLDNLKVFSEAVIIALIIRSFVFEPFHIPSGSMKDGLLEGDFIFVTKYSYGYSKYSFPLAIIPFKDRIFNKEPERGEVIVFRLPSNPSINYIKRFNPIFTLVQILNIALIKSMILMIVSKNAMPLSISFLTY